MSYAQYAPTAIAAAQAFGIDPGIFIAQITQESGWNPTITSPAGAQGIAQFMPATAAGMGVDPLDPEDALYGAAALMRQNLDMFGGDYSLALAAYNAGPGAVQQYGGIPPYAETQQYVSTILGGAQGGDDMAFPDLWPFNNGDDEEDERNPLDEYTWSPEERVKFLSDAGLQWVSGNGPDAIWRMPDGDTITEVNAFTKLLEGSGSINHPAGSTSSPSAPPRVTSNGVTYERQPDGTWRPATGIPPSMGSTAAPSGFTLSPGQARFDASGRPIATYPTESDPYAAIKLQQSQMDLAIKQQNLRFLQDKHAFEMEMGHKQEARATQAQIFNQQMDIQRLSFDVQQANIANERARQQQLQGLASDIGALAADPGDRARYASTVLANSGMAFGQDKAVGDMRTTDSLMPLEALLRQRNDLMGGTPQVGVQMPTALGSGINLAQLGQPQVTGAPDQTPGYTTPLNVEGGQPPLPGPVYLNPDEIKAGAQWAPTQGFEQPAGVGGIDLASILGPDRDLPLKAKGGMEDEAFIAGEAGPEIVIPHGDGKAVILNAEQAKVAGIDLSKLQKYADGGLFDGLIKDQDRGLATDFLTEATTRAKAGTPWAGTGIPGPTFASSPGFDPLVLEFMASINAMETGVPAASYKYNAALRRPAGVGEAPIRRTA